MDNPYFIKTEEDKHFIINSESHLPSIENDYLLNYINDFDHHKHKS